MVSFMSSTASIRNTLDTPLLVVGGSILPYEGRGNKGVEKTT
jgi:hypothetical protein